jgi:hypothetical protein
VKEIRTEIEIAAPPDVVWAILTDLPSLPSWNPFMIEASGDLAVGSQLRVRLRPPGRRAFTFRPTVTVLEPGRRFVWLGRTVFAGIFDGEHIHELDDRGGGRSRYHQVERFRGVLTPFVGALLKDTERGFKAMNTALKQRAESSYRG